MKKPILPFLVACSIFFSGCKKDQPMVDRPDEIKKLLIRGQWFYQSLRTNFCDDLGPRTYSDATPEELYKAAPLTFYEQGMVNFRNDNYKFRITSTNGNDSLFIDAPTQIKCKILSLGNDQMMLHLQYNARIPFVYAGTNELAFYTTYLMETANFTHTKFDRL